MPEKLTVLVPCKNEERNIRDCLRSVRDIADELLVADSGSTDRTMEIAREFGARIIQREYVNSADFKNWAIPQAAHNWVMVVDADERVTPGLAREVRRVLDEGPRYDAYRVGRIGYFFGHRIRHCGWGRETLIRLFKRELRYETKHVHADVVVPSGKIGRLRGELEHYTCWTFEQYFEKFGRYTTWSAMDLAEKGKKATLLKMLYKPLFRFLRQYVLQLGFLDGKAGLVLCGLSAFSVFTRYAKLWAMREAPHQPAESAAQRAGEGLKQ